MIKVEFLRAFMVAIVRRKSNEMLKLNTRFFIKYIITKNMELW